MGSANNCSLWLLSQLEALHDLAVEILFVSLPPSSLRKENYQIARLSLRNEFALHLWNQRQERFWRLLACG